MKLYLVGPMSHIAQLNFPAFEEAAKALREDGYVVVSPHELDDEAHRAKAWACKTGEMEDLDQLWAECLARDLVTISTEGIDALVVLPDWQHSRGAALETFLGYRLFGLPVFAYGAVLLSVSALELDQAHLAFRG